MKKSITTVASIFTLSLLFSSNAVAGVHAKKLYEALTVTAVILEEDSLSHIIMAKTIGGVNCEMIDYVGAKSWKKSAYECFLDIDTVDAEALYNNLAGDEYNVTPTGETKLAVFEKEAGRLICSKRFALNVTKPTYKYACRID